jgi:5-hydroxyisourate hydrolase
VTISTHVLDISAGCPAASVAVRLEREEGAVWRVVGEGTTNQDGRLSTLVAPDVLLLPGEYRLVFEIGAYFAARQVDTFYRRAVVEFVAGDPSAHYHVPLLVSPYGYTTYRGS